MKRKTMKRKKLRNGRNPNLPAAKIPKTFAPQFWKEADGRSAAIREIRQRVELLKEHAGADSFQKSILAERAIFVALQLETQEIEATEGTAKLDAGRYTQGVNCLVGLLKALGLDKKVKSAETLKNYIGASDEEE